MSRRLYPRPRWNSGVTRSYAAPTRPPSQGRALQLTRRGSVARVPQLVRSSLRRTACAAQLSASPSPSQCAGRRSRAAAARGSDLFIGL